MAAPVGPKKVHRYTLEFKIQAVKLANHPEIQTQDVAHALDIHPFMLSKWKKDYREGRLEAAAGAEGRPGEARAQAPGETAGGEGPGAARGAGARAKARRARGGA